MVRVFDGQARQKGLWLNLDMDVASDRHVLIDPLRFKQILLNLVSNAIKFTDKGGINIRVSAAPLADDHLALEVSVEDTGIGIAKHEQERLFEPFTQAQHSVGSSRGGTGLGLSICRKLADMMGGTIHLDSEPGVGTAACVRLTLQTLEPSAVSVEPAAKPVREANRSLQVLIVDDHPANRMLLAQQLMHLSHHVVTADDGAMALEHWSPGRFDVVITDCNMPVLNGYALASRIREIELEHDASPCVILGLTANAQHDEIARCREAGMDDCLFKPIGLEALRARLAQVPHTADGVDSSLKLLSLGFDLRIVEELNGHAPDLTRQFIEQLHACNQTDAQQLDTLLIAQDWSQLSDLAHRIKGASRLIRADTLRDCCADLESACRDGLDEDEVRKRAQQVREAMDALQGQLLAYLHSHPMIPTAIHP
ncbi:Virulence sensor protein BvgS precursor [compost metagenome]